jgi:hypothetical protein
VDFVTRTNKAELPGVADLRAALQWRLFPENLASARDTLWRLCFNHVDTIRNIQFSLLNGIFKRVTIGLKSVVKGESVFSAGCQNHTDRRLWIAAEHLNGREGSATEANPDDFRSVP